MQAIQKKFIGTWQLVHSVEIDNKGNKHYPFGEDAMGYIIYLDTGIMAVQICKKNRSASGEVTKEYLAYFGKYEIDEKQELARHFLQGDLNPERIGKIMERKYHFYDDKLSLRPWNDGTNREILWKKVQPL